MTSTSAEARRQFVDTNVFLYAYGRAQDARHDRALLLVRNLWTERLGAISVQVLQEFLVNVTKKVKGPVDATIARRRVRHLSTWITHTPSPTDVLEAIDIHRDYDISFWDAMIVRSASQLGCETLWTEDLNPGQVYRGIRVENPFA